MKIPKNKKIFIYIQFAGLVIITASLITFALFSSRSPLSIYSKPTPPSDMAEVFENMINKSQAVSYVSEKRTIKNIEGSIIGETYTTYDVRDLSKARVFSSTEAFTYDEDPNNDIKINFIETPNGTFYSVVKYQNQNHSGISPWYEVNEDHTNNPISNIFSKRLLEVLTGSSVSDFQQQYMGFYVPGSYNIASRKKLAQQVPQIQPYQWFSNNVSEVQIDGRKYYNYKFLYDSESITAFNELLAKAHNIKLSEAIIQGHNRNDTKLMSFFINPESGYLERVDLPTIDNLVQTIEYYDYNVPSIIESPTPISTLNERVFGQFLN